MSAHPIPARQRPLGLALALALAVVVAIPAVPADAREKPSRREVQARFMWAMATVESNHDHYARNRSSGAFGKYQIMPFNWPAWAAKYLGDADADQTPWNQERVATGKLRDLREWLGSWRRVAYWWLTGTTTRNERRWSSVARRYVDAIDDLRERAPKGGASMPARRGAAGRGDWRRSGSAQRLHRGANGRRWSARGAIEDGQVLKVRRATKRRGVTWLRVLTKDGRLGWIRRARTIPSHPPARPSRWRTVTDRGRTEAKRDRSGRGERRDVRVRPR